MSQIPTIMVKHLGLAAFIKMQGGKLVEVKDRYFVFESTRTIDSWRVEYNNSCCMRHDSIVCELRHHLKPQ